MDNLFNLKLLWKKANGKLPWFGYEYVCFEKNKSIYLNCQLIKKLGIFEYGEFIKLIIYNYFLPECNFYLYSEKISPSIFTIIRHPNELSLLEIRYIVSNLIYLKLNPDLFLIWVNYNELLEQFQIDNIEPDLLHKLILFKIEMIENYNYNSNFNMLMINDWRLEILKEFKLMIRPDLDFKRLDLDFLDYLKLVSIKTKINFNSEEFIITNNFTKLSSGIKIIEKILGIVINVKKWQ